MPVPTLGVPLLLLTLTLPAGAEFDVRLRDPLNSKTAQVEDRIEATTVADVRDERGDLFASAGSLMRGIVSAVTPATRADPKGSLTVVFERITIDDRAYPVRTTVWQAPPSAGAKEKPGIGAGAVIGALFGGGLFGGGKIVATDGADVELRAGTVLRVRLDAPLTLR